MTVPDYGPRSRPDRVGTEARLPCQVGEFPRQSVASWAGSWSAGRLQARVRAGLSGPLDRHPDQVAPLHPGAVVVAHVAEPEQLAEHEPGVAGALADAAVGDDVVVGLEAELALVDGPQLVDLLEGAVLVGRPLPGHVGRAGDVAAAQRPLLGVVGHGQQLARVLAGRAHVDQPAATPDV